MAAVVIVFFGAGFGGALRHLVNVAAARALGADFPWGTFIINVTGSTVMGLIAGWLAFRAGENWSQHARLFLMTGVLGGYTTFSAFSLDALLLWERGAILSAALYVLLSVAASVAGVAGGIHFVRSLT